MKLKRVFSVLLVLLTVVSLTACGASSSGNAAGAGYGGEILIGNLQDLSGPTSVWGKAITRGVEMSIAKINAEGGINGKKLKLITYDTQNDVQQAINAYNRLATSDKVSAVVGPPVSNIGIALAPISERVKVPIVGSYLDERATTKPDGKPYTYMFLMQPSAGQQAEMMAGYAMDKMHLKKFAVFYNQANAYSVSLSKPFVDYVKSHGGQILVEDTYKATDKDFTTQLAQIKNAHVDAVYVPNYIQELVLIAQQARQMGLDVPLLAGLDAAAPFAKLAGSASNNVIFPNNVSNDEPQLKGVYDAYKKEYGEEPLNKVFIGYDSLTLIAQAIKNANSLDTTKIAEALAHLKDVKGTTGTISISPATHRPYGLSMVMFEIENGQYIAKQRYLTNDLKHQ